MHEWSPQQKNFLEFAEHGSGSCVLEAVAGAGKTTTLIEAAKLIRGQVALIAFNKKIAMEIKEKLVKAGLEWKKAQGGTVHSFGFSAYRKFFPNVAVDDAKLDVIFERLGFDDKTIGYKNSICKLVGLAKQAAFGMPGCPKIDDREDWLSMNSKHDVLNFDDDAYEEEIMFGIVIPACIRVLRKSVETKDVIDFSDMLYMPLMHNVKFWRFDCVFVDEAQDTNVARRLVAAKMLKPGGRLIAVGDRHQAIYGFTGADSDALDIIRASFNCASMPLTVTYRCPKKVVDFARQWVNHIEAHETAPEGEILSMSFEDFLNAERSESSAILCRNVKPLVATAMRLISKRIPCRVEGRDIGAGLMKIVNRFKVKTIDKLEERMRAHLDKQRVRFAEKKEFGKIQQLEDQIDTIQVLCDAARAGGHHEIDGVRQIIDDLFADDVKNVIVLSTIHKSKGREWSDVYWLNRKTTLPSPYAKQSWQRVQELNLCYVAATRAQRRLIEMDV